MSVAVVVLTVLAIVAILVGVALVVTLIRRPSRTTATQIDHPARTDAAEVVAAGVPGPGAVVVGSLLTEPHRNSATPPAPPTPSGWSSAALPTSRPQAPPLAVSAAADVVAAEQARLGEASRKSRAEATELLAKAKAEVEQAGRVREAAEVEARSMRSDLREQRTDLERREQRLAEREERLDAAQRLLDTRLEGMAAAQAELAVRERELATLEAERIAVLERTAGLSVAEAKSELVKAIETSAKREASLIVRDIEHEAQEEGQSRARKIVVGAIQRVASEATTESAVSVLHLPSDEMKGRIIGREGRNIRTFESITGVNLIIDDTPEAVLLSCFDPVRREVARVALESLVLDGRIHPHRIEEVYERSKTDVEALCLRAAEDALVEVGVTDLHPELVTLLGRLRYRTSYGQNVLKHLLESAHIAGMMASELGLDPTLLRRCAFLHDIGKALTHEVEGSHAIIGAEVARRYGESDDVVHAIEAHHNEVEMHTLEAVLTQTADAISGGRPGARRESIEAYVKRLQRLEEIAMSYEGVDRVFAMQAGREVRVMVLPGVVDDVQAQVVARDIAKRVEEELTYPGQIRITVVRESRATELAR